MELHRSPELNPAESLAAPEAATVRRLATSPPIRRSSMAPRRWPPGQRLFRGLRSPRRDAPDEADIAYATANSRGALLRRSILLLLVLAQTWIAISMMRRVLPYHGEQPLEMLVLVLFGILFAWVSAGFWTAVMGFVQLLAGGRQSISGKEAGNAPIAPEARTAIVMPICNEHVARVFAGLRATYESLAKTGDIDRFDFYVLSDSGDPDARVAELDAWQRVCRELDAAPRIFYRWRRNRIKRKSGNVADFCRRWGRNYRYMVVLDADSVMSGECLVKLVRLMETNPATGIIQTAPRPAGRETLYARIQQFASHVYGPLYIAGLHFWQLGESHYWGHNAIIRIAPFMRNCALGRLPGKGPLSGEILSHDFVEAALMRRAGWAVWIAYDLDGSYEETPPNLIDELIRERRWCYGNLMNFRLFPTKGFHPVHRAVFMTGVIAYVSAPLWFLFLLVSTALLATHTLSEPQYFLQPRQLFPVWPEWHPERAMALFGATATLLFAPKLLSVLLICASGAKRFGGVLALAGGVVMEAVFSALLAPIRMLFHTQFVIAALCGRPIRWKSPPREDAETSWSDALRRHGWHTVLGVLWAGGVYWLNPSFLWWLLPVVGALMLSIPVSVISSRVSWGRGLRDLGVFLIPEEIEAPDELRCLSEQLAAPLADADFVRAARDPALNALVRAAYARGGRRPAWLQRARLRLIEQALKSGPRFLAHQQRAVLIGDATALAQLHEQIRAAREIHPDWRTT